MPAFRGRVDAWCPPHNNFPLFVYPVLFLGVVHHRRLASHVGSMTVFIDLSIFIYVSCYVMMVLSKGSLRLYLASLFLVYFRTRKYDAMKQFVLVIAIITGR